MIARGGPEGVHVHDVRHGPVLTAHPDQTAGKNESEHHLCADDVLPDAASRRRSRYRSFRAPRFHVPVGVAHGRRREQERCHSDDRDEGRARTPGRAQGICGQGMRGVNDASVRRAESYGCAFVVVWRSFRHIGRVQARYTRKLSRSTGGHWRSRRGLSAASIPTLPRVENFTGPLERTNRTVEALGARSSRRSRQYRGWRCSGRPGRRSG